MIEICQITEQMLPKLCESYEVAGTLRPQMAEKAGLTEKVKVVAGAGDNAAAAVGTGTVGEGRCNISLGTSGTVFISSKISELINITASIPLHMQTATII